MTRIRVISPNGERGTIEDSELTTAMEEGFRILEDIPEAPKGYLQQAEEAIMGNPLGRFAVGAGESLKNQLANIANIIPGVNLPVTKSGEGLAYELGNIGGNLAGFLGGGGALNLARKGLETAPAIGQSMKALGGEGVSGMARRGIGSAAYGATQSPEEREAEALKGGALSVGLELLGKAGSGIASAVRPQKYAESIWKEISGGKTLEENAKALAQGIKESYSRNVKEPSEMFNKIKKEVGNDSIYPGFEKSSVRMEDINKTISDVKSRGFDTSQLEKILEQQYGIKNMPSSESYINNIRSGLDNETYGLFNFGTKKLHKKFEDNPTYENAHTLLKQLGVRERQLQSKLDTGKIDHHELSALEAHREAKELLKNDITSSLSSKNPKLAEEFNQANKLWMENVSPYKAHPLIYKMARGKVENPDRISSLFKHPEGDIKKIMEDLGDKGANQILYSQLGKLTKKGLPEHLIDKSQQLKNQGLESYFSPKLQEQLDSLSGKVTRRNLAQKGTLGLGGALVGSKIFGPAGAAVGAGSALLKTPDIAGKISPITQALSKISPSYDIIRKILLSNIVGTPTRKQIQEREERYGT